MKLSDFPWATMSGFDVYTAIENHSDSKEDTEEMMQAWLRAKTPRPEAAPKKRESIVTEVGDDSIIYLQLENFEEGEHVEVMVTPHEPQSSGS